MEQNKLESILNDFNEANKNLDKNNKEALASVYALVKLLDINTDDFEKEKKRLLNNLK